MLRTLNELEHRLDAGDEGFVLQPAFGRRGGVALAPGGDSGGGVY